jgi:MoxR-like ATPase
VWPNVYPGLYPKTAKGILLYGVPGTGKSLIAKATANELNLGSKYDQNLHVLYFAPQGGDLKGKYVGETEKNIQAYFHCASEAANICQKQKNEAAKKNNQPENHRVLSIIFIDEVDALARDRTTDDSGMMSLSVNALLQALDGIWSRENVAVIAATNFPWDLDSAFLRRFDQKIMIDLPNASDILKIMDDNINRFVSKIERYIKDECKEILNGKKWYVRKRVFETLFPGVNANLLQTTFENQAESNPILKDRALELETSNSIKFISEYFALPIEQQQKYYSNKEPRPFDEYVRKTEKGKLTCAVGCERPMVSNWRKSPYRVYIDGLTNPSLSTIATIMQVNKFSPSDVNKLCGNIFRIVGDRARRNASFYRMTYAQFCDKTCNITENDGVPIPESLYKNINVHISTLSLTNKELREKFNNRNNVVPIKRPKVSQIRFTFKEKTRIFIHKSLAAQETFINDPSIEDFWINQQSQKNPDTPLEVLFKIKVGVQKTLNIEPKQGPIQTTQDLYIISTISKRGLREKWFSWESWKPTWGFGGKSLETLEKKNKEKQSMYESLIENMSQFIFKDVDGQYYTNYGDRDMYAKLREQLKQKMLIFNYDESNSKAFYDTSFKEGCWECPQVTGEWPLLSKEDQDKVKFELDEITVAGEFMAEPDKETFFTFDLRDDDFENQLSKTASSIKTEEYNELIKYKKDPSNYKKPAKPTA